jgi:hypothetical protein
MNCLRTTQQIESNRAKAWFEAPTYADTLGKRTGRCSREAAAPVDDALVLGGGDQRAGVCMPARKPLPPRSTAATRYATLWAARKCMGTS